MAKESYVQVALITMRNIDGNGLMKDIPLYVKVRNVSGNGISKMEDELFGKISATLLKHYESQICHHVVNLKSGGFNNVS